MAHVTKDRYGEPLYCGRTWVVETLCVWRKCFNEHDCGHLNSQGKWVKDGRCLTNYHRGCPTGYPFHACCDKPTFTKRKSAGRKRCQSCGVMVPAVIWKEQRE